MTTNKNKLTKNFTKAELECRCGGQYCNGRVPKDILLEKLQAVRDEYGKPLTPTSGFRCKRWNKEVGGQPESWHKRGLAVDLYCTDAVEKGILLKLLVKHGFKGLQFKSTYIHADMRPREKLEVF